MTMPMSPPRGPRGPEALSPERRRVRELNDSLETVAQRGELMRWNFGEVSLEESQRNSGVARDFLGANYEGAEGRRGTAALILDHVDAAGTARNMAERWRRQNLPEDDENRLTESLLGAEPPTLEEMQDPDAKIMLFDGQEGRYHILKDGDEPRVVNGVVYQVQRGSLLASPLGPEGVGDVEDYRVFAAKGLRERAAAGEAAEELTPSELGEGEVETPADPEDAEALSSEDRKTNRGYFERNIKPGVVIATTRGNSIARFTVVGGVYIDVVGRKGVDVTDQEDGSTAWLSIDELSRDPFAILEHHVAPLPEEGRTRKREAEVSDEENDPDSLINFDTSGMTPEEIADRTIEIVDNVRQGRIEIINEDDSNIVGITEAKNVRPNIYETQREGRRNSIVARTDHQRFNFDALMRPFREGASKNLDVMFANRKGTDIVFGVGDGVSSNELSSRASTALQEYFNNFDPRQFDSREEVARAMSAGLNEIRRGLFEGMQREFPNETERNEKMRNLATTACVGSVIERDGRKHLIVLNAGDSRIGVKNSESGEFHWLTADQVLADQPNVVTNSVSPEENPDSTRDIVTFGEVEEDDILIAVTDGVVGDRAEDQRSDDWYRDVLSNNTLEEASRILVEETTKRDDAAAVVVKVR